MSGQRSILLISTLQSISYSVDGPWVTCKCICTHRQFNLILIKPFTSAKCARQRRDPGRGFLRAVCRTRRNAVKKKKWLGFSGNFGNIKENRGSNFTLECSYSERLSIVSQYKSVFTEVFLYPDMIIFFLNAPLRSFLIPQSRADSSYIIIERLFLSPPLHGPPPAPPFCSPSPLSVAAPLWKPFCVLLLNLQTGLDREQQCSSESARSSSCEGGFHGGRYLDGVISGE